MDYEHMATSLGHMVASDTVHFHRSKTRYSSGFFMILLVVLATPPHGSIMEMDNILLGLYLCFVTVGCELKLY